MKWFVPVLVSIFLTLCCALPCSAQDKWGNLVVESGKVFDEMTRMPEEGIPESLLKDCYAVAIFPSTIGGGFIVGGKFGQGVIIAKDTTKHTWSAPAIFDLAGGSFGWQIGGQATDILLLVMNERGLDGLIQSSFKLGGDASVAAGPVGRDAEAAIDLQLKGGILSYSRSRGLFAGIKLEGAILSFNKEANASLYGTGVSAQDILITKKIQPSKDAERLLSSLSKY